MLKDATLRSTALVGALIVLTSAGGSLVAQAQGTSGGESGTRYRSSLGLTRNEAVVFVGDSASGALSPTRVGVAGVQYMYIIRPDRRVGLLADAELQLGLLGRGSAPALTTTHIFGGHAMAGPRTRLGGIPVFAHALGGVSALRLTGDEITLGGGTSSPTIYYVGGSKSDAAFRDFLNNYRTSRNRTVVEFPGSSRSSPVAHFGLSGDWGRARFSGDFLRIDREGPQWGVVRAGVGMRF